MDSNPTVQQPVAPTAPADPVAQRAEAARQFRYDPNKGFFQQLTENPFFTASYTCVSI
ncbi:hypothetical protein KEM55_009252 [Ascosphaera atra]|nr:hypothetical protein KEM55_009252 [Ascosphaera atra]